MLLSLSLAFLVTISGAFATYIYDRGASLGSRLGTGACVGLGSFGLIGFILASFAGLTTFVIALATIITASPLVLLLSRNYRERLQRDLEENSIAIRRAISRPSGSDLGYLIYYGGAAVLLWFIFDRAMFERPDGIYTGVLNNFGDLPFHLSVVTSFAYGKNFPPEDPTFAGVRFTYPFLTDFISAVFVRCGASLRDSMFIENFVVAVAFIGVLHRWAWEMLRDRVAAVLTPLLVLLNGGFGWMLLFVAASKSDRGLLGVLTHLPPSFTVIPETTWRWGNAVSSLLVPQRGILLGLPLAVIVFTQWWLATNDGEIEPGAGTTERNKKKQDRNTQKFGTRKQRSAEQNARSAAAIKGKGGADLRSPTSSAAPSSATIRMIAAGFVAGLLPLVHAHSFVVVMAMSACICLLQRRWRLWITFALVASIIALPQMWWSTRGSAVHPASFFAMAFGWDHGEENPVWFWFKNTGLFIPLLVAALCWRGRDYLVPRRLLLFYLPFTLCFIVPNVMKMAPWIWDNVKVLFYWWLASAPLVALLLSRLWRRGPLQRGVAVALFACLTLAGALDVAGIVMRSGEFQLFDPDGVRFAEIIKQQTQPRSLIIHAPVHNTPVFLTGRRSLMGYPGHIWTHGLEFAPRESEIKRIYSGALDAEMLLHREGVEYAVVGPLEKLVMPIDQSFFARFKKVGEAGEYRLYKINP